MTQYNITLEAEDVQGLFSSDQGVAIGSIQNSVYEA